MQNESPSGGGTGPHPWVPDPSGEPDEFAVVEDFGDALFAAGERCMRYRGLMLVARREDARNPRPRGEPRRADQVRDAFLRFIRVTVALAGIPTAMGELPRPVEREPPP